LWSLAITDAAEAGDFTVSSWHIDAGRSGSKIEGRPALAEALERIRGGEAGGLVVSKIDRLGRSHDVMVLVERAQREGWRLVALDVGADTSTPAGEMVAAALTIAARFEWRRISERQIEKHDELRRQGRPRGRPAVPAEVADRIITMREQGMTLRAIGAQLQIEGVETAREGRAWHAATIKSAIETRRRELSATAQ
jgi:DNA invertase Pin-like site-specific DNA recombinase